eukprot:3589686-Pyramimonas_sp.AAC.2
MKTLATMYHVDRSRAAMMTSMFTLVGREYDRESYDGVTRIGHVDGIDVGHGDDDGVGGRKGDGDNGGSR